MQDVAGHREHEEEVEELAQYGVLEYQFRGLNLFYPCPNLIRTFKASPSTSTRPKAHSSAKLCFRTHPSCFRPPFYLSQEAPATPQEDSLNSCGVWSDTAAALVISSMTTWGASTYMLVVCVSRCTFSQSRTSPLSLITEYRSNSDY
jgi:hypothetical protein